MATGGVPPVPFFTMGTGMPPESQNNPNAGERPAQLHRLEDPLRRLLARGGTNTGRS